jgi:hypothetical protein
MTTCALADMHVAHVSYTSTLLTSLLDALPLVVGDTNLLEPWGEETVSSQLLSCSKAFLVNGQCRHLTAPVIGVLWCNFALVAAWILNLCFIPLASQDS